MARTQKLKKGVRKERVAEKENLASKEIEERKPEKTRRRLSKEEKQALIIIGFMVLALVGFLVFFLIFKNAGAFVYNGIKFKKTNYNSLIFYHGRIGMTTSAGVFNYNLYLRNDPRVLKNVPVNISLTLRKKGYISFQPEINNCYGTNLATYELASFLSALGMKVEGATTSHEFAIDEGIPEKDCADAVNQTVIVLQKANETSIQQRGDCYIMDIANCRVIEATEAFILAIVKELWQIKAA